MYYDTLNQERTARYMKRRGFTLAEVLITLGIIGVVAALTAPALVQNAGSAQTGPKLAKAVSTWELACENLLNDQGANGIHAIMTGDNVAAKGENLGNLLTNYIKMSHYDTGAGKYGLEGSEVQVTNFHGAEPVAQGSQGRLAINSIGVSSAKFLTKDGFLYMIAPSLAGGAHSLAAHKDLIGYVSVDINGLAEPNRLGKDIFTFALYNDGSLRPMGSQNWKDGGADGHSTFNDQFNWKEGTTDVCNAENVTSGLTCAGSIFENNLKVIYQ